jgi:flagellin-like hook-associated protein FlgL
MSDITLSAGVRQNLLSLQNTASLMSLTQNRLATGKKVNTALDNPGSYFTSQSLNNRASDLNDLLDSIGQAQQTLQAANNGITSLTNLVNSAKSIAKQAEQVTQPQATFNSIDETGDVAFAETNGTTTGSATVGTLASGDAGNLVLTVGSTNYTVALASGDSLSNIVDKINAVTGASGANVITASDSGGKLQLTANNSDVDFPVASGSTAATLTALGLTSGTAVTSSNMLDLSSGLSGKTLTVQANGGASKTITFGTGGGEVSTAAELQTALSGTGVSASIDGSNHLVLSVASTKGTQNSLTLSGSATGSGAGTIGIAAVTDALGNENPPAVDSTRANYQSQFNDLLSQIDQLANDASYNGVNLLNGDQLKVAFNEQGSSSITIKGVDFTSAGLGLTAVSGNGFQSNDTIEATLTTLDSALTSLRTQASSFGSNLTTVQTRQDFTKNMISTLQTGADNLVLADTNEEGANLLALQTRQQLSTTALSLSAQQDQAVLRLFG